jgi:hypothetical protein
MPRRGGMGRQVRRQRRRRRRRRRILVGGLVAFGAYKMSTKDADRVKEHTGVDPEELEDDELEQAMSELGIEQQKVTDADVEEGAAPAPAAAPAAPAAGGGTGDYVEELQKLASLRDAGILTDEEFNAKKAQILGLN